MRSRSRVCDLPAEARRTLTWDQGSEMACHDQIADLFIDGVFFAYPGRPWERALNENTNGLLRQYFPKRTDLSIHTADDLRAVERAPQQPAPQDARLAHTRPGLRRRPTLALTRVLRRPIESALEPARR